MSVSIETLMTRVRRLADIENALDRFPDAEVQDYVQRGLARWHRTLAQEFSGFWKTSTTIVVAPGSNLIRIGSVSIPTDIPDFLSLVRLQFQDGSAPSGWRQVLPVQEDEMEQFSSVQGWGRPRGYMLQSDSIFLFPETDAGGTYRVWYVAKWVDHDDPADAIEDWDDWVQLAVFDAAIAIKRKDEDEVNDLLQEREALAAEVRAAAAARNVGGATHTTNVQDDVSDWSLFR